MTEDEESKQRWKQVGVYLTIPFILSVSPILGWLIGNWLDKRLHTAPFLMYGGVLLGFIAGFREIYRIIKRFGDGK
ncbi:MAG: AtpZ/AtpI family protein [Parachlamydia sp.]|nr:AtpZ/AtpI family protein [Parachlamydia sp.]